MNDFTRDPTFSGSDFEGFHQDRNFNPGYENMNRSRDYFADNGHFQGSGNFNSAFENSYAPSNESSPLYYRRPHLLSNPDNSLLGRPHLLSNPDNSLLGRFPDDASTFPQASEATQIFSPYSTFEEVQNEEQYQDNGNSMGHQQSLLPNPRVYKAHPFSAAQKQKFKKIPFGEHCRDNGNPMNPHLQPNPNVYKADPFSAPQKQKFLKKFQAIGEKRPLLNSVPKQRNQGEMPQTILRSRPAFPKPPFPNPALSQHQQTQELLTSTEAFPMSNKQAKKYQWYMKQKAQNQKIWQAKNKPFQINYHQNNTSVTPKLISSPTKKKEASTPVLVNKKPKFTIVKSIKQAQPIPKIDANATVVTNNNNKSIKPAQPMPKMDTNATVVTNNKMAVLPSDFPVSRLSEEQSKKVEAAIMEAIWACESGTGPQFTQTDFIRGMLFINPANERSIQWLKENIPKLSPWEGAALQVRPEDDVTETAMAEVSIETKSLPNKDPKAILLLLGKQNPNLNIREWAVLLVKEKEGGLTLFLEMTKASLKQLKAGGLKAFLGLTQLSFRNIDKLPDDKTESQNKKTK